LQARAGAEVTIAEGLVDGHRSLEEGNGFRRRPAAETAVARLSDDVGRSQRNRDGNAWDRSNVP
jgi:hypothetical protein